MVDPLEAVLDKLKLRAWHQHPGFVRDGIIDPTRWGTRARVLFLLKEAHDKTEPRKDWDLRELLRMVGPRWQMWKAAASWALVCNELSKSYCSGYLETMLNHDELRECLLSSAVVNLKKSDGASRSIREDLDTWAERDGDLIREQVELIQPELVICGSTWKSVSRIWPVHNRRAEWLYEANRLYFLDFWHPSVIAEKIRMKHFGLLNDWLRLAFPNGLSQPRSEP